jgi:hypothetical protein
VLPLSKVKHTDPINCPCKKTKINVDIDIESKRATVMAEMRQKNK